MVSYSISSSISFSRRAYTRIFSPLQAPGPTPKTYRIGPYSKQKYIITSYLFSNRRYSPWMTLVSATILDHSSWFLAILLQPRGPDSASPPPGHRATSPCASFPYSSCAPCSIFLTSLHGSILSTCSNRCSLSLIAGMISGSRYSSASSVFLLICHS